MSIDATLLEGVSGVGIYKVLAGVNTTLASYNDEVGAAAHDGLDGNGSLQHLDWRALYTQFQRDHVLGTVPYRWEKDHTDATLVQVIFDSLDILVLDGPMFHDGAVSGADKALEVKKHLGIDLATPLMEALGEQGKVALVRETEEEWELVIPHQLLPKLKFSERVVALFRRHQQFQVTHKWCQPGGKWEAWQEGMETECICNLDMSWLPSRSSEIKQD